MVKEQRVVTVSQADGMIVEMTASDDDLDWDKVKPEGVRKLRDKMTEVLRAAQGNEAGQEAEGRDGPGG